MISKQDQINFYIEELEYLELEVKDTFETSIENLFASSKLFFGRFLFHDPKRGVTHFELILNKSLDTPRVRSSFYCFVLKEKYRKKANRIKDSYREMCNELNEFEDTSKVYLIDIYKNKESGKFCCLLNDLSTTFLDSLDTGMVVAMGPEMPPFGYLWNLNQYSKNLLFENTNLAERILEFDFTINKTRTPEILSEEQNITKIIRNTLEENDIVIFQGPPGCGKTYLIAELISELLVEKASVLLTTLTNQALIEVCQKPALKDLMQQGHLSKTGLSSSELVKAKGLVLAKDVVPLKRHCLLSTYYKMSSLWLLVDDNYPLFDFVIVEEASQAFLTTISGAIKLAKKVIVVGDPLQIQPIVRNKNKYRVSSKIDYLINGLETLCYADNIPFLRKLETRRLNNRSTDYTNCFYDNTLISKLTQNDFSNELNTFSFLSKFMHPNGGPTLIKFAFSNPGKIVPESIPFLVNALSDLSKDKKYNRIAILTPFIRTLNYLVSELRSNCSFSDYLIDTVDRVQGLDVDYCFYIIPADGYPFSLNINKFNVATSRAKVATFILADSNLINEMVAHQQVTRYLNKLEQEFSFIID